MAFSVRLSYQARDADALRPGAIGVTKGAALLTDHHGLDVARHAAVGVHPVQRRERGRRLGQQRHVGLDGALLDGRHVWRVAHARPVSPADKVDRGARPLGLEGAGLERGNLIKGTRLGGGAKDLPRRGSRSRGWGSPSPPTSSGARGWPSATAAWRPTRPTAEASAPSTRRRPRCPPGRRAGGPDPSRHGFGGAAARWRRAEGRSRPPAEVGASAPEREK